MNRDDDDLDAGHPLPVIGEELPGWSSFVAANLALDGILTTFVATARNSSIEPLAQRTRKILQEEGAGPCRGVAAADLSHRWQRSGAIAVADR